MEFLQVKFESEEEIYKSFDQIAHKFCNSVALKINKSYYRIVDFEFYAYSEEIFPDPQTHKHELQKENAKFYFHGAGVDITFGDGTNYGGILIRGVVKLCKDSSEQNGFMMKRVEGPQNVVTEIFSNLNSLIECEPNEISLIDIETDKDINFVSMIHCFKTKRFGLTPKDKDPKGKYADLPLRYIAVLQKTPDFEQKIKGIESLVTNDVKEGRLKEEKDIEILGYKKNFK